MFRGNIEELVPVCPKKEKKKKIWRDLAGVDILLLSVTCPSTKAVWSS